MSDYSDYSDFDSDEEPPGHISQGHNNDPTLQLNNALAKVKHWRSKFSKCHREKEKKDAALKDASLKIKELSEIKLAHDQLKVDCDVDKRNYDLRIANEQDQTKKFQGMLKQTKMTLEDMTQKHKEIAELNKVNEAKLFQTKIDYAGIVSNVAGLEEQTTELRDELKSAKSLINDQANRLQEVSGERSSIEKDNQLLTQRCQELSSQVNEFRQICEKLDNKYGSLAQEHLTLKNDSQQSTSTLNRSITDSKEETLSLTKERDSLSLNLSHTKEAFEETQKKLTEIQGLYQKEKSSADESSILLRQSEMSIQHLKELYTEKEAQYQKQVTSLEGLVATLRKEVDKTREQLLDAQSQRGGMTMSNSNQEQIASLNTELGHLTATSTHLKDKITQLENEKQIGTERLQKLEEDKNLLVLAKNELEIEMGRQRDGFKDELRELKNEIKNGENKQEVLKKKLDGSREELSKMEHEVRSLQTNISDKTNTSDRLSEEIGVLKADNNVITHQVNELRTKSQEYVNEIENLKTRITVLQEDNKNIRLKSEDSVLKVKEKEVIFKELQDNLSEAQQKLYAEQIKHIEEINLLKEELQEKLYNLESDLKQTKYERDAKDEQLVNLRQKISKRAEDKVVSTAPVPAGISEEAAGQYRELFDKYSAQQTEMQQLKSDKIMLDNSVTQLKFNLETEREKLAATEKALQDTTDILNTTKEKMRDVETQSNKANNDILRLEELLKVEKDRYDRLQQEFDLGKTNVQKLNVAVGTHKEQIEKLKDNLKQKTTELEATSKDIAEKDRMLSSEAKLRLHISSQISSDNTHESALQTEKRKVEKLEEKCETLLHQVEKLKASLEDCDSAKKKLRDELDESAKSQPNVSRYEDKVKTLKQKVISDRESAKKAQEDLTRKVRKCQTSAKEEAVQRKEMTDKYIAIKSEVGELQGKITVLLADNERLKAQQETLQKERTDLQQQKTDLECLIRTDYVMRTEVEMSKKSLEAKTRVEMNKKLHEMNQKLDHDNKSREAIEKFKAATEIKIREDLERSSRHLKQKVTECNEQFDHQEKQIANLQLENEKLKHILSEERRSMERLLPTLSEGGPVVPPLSFPATPRSPLKQCDNRNIRATQDANATWMLMKSKLNESLNRFMVEPDPLPSCGHRSPGQVTPGRVTPGSRRGTPPSQRGRMELNIDADPARTSADSFF